MHTSQRGVALIITLLMVSLFSALGLGLALSSAAARMADHNHEDAVLTLNAAESALNLAIRDLSAIADWSLALNGSLRGSITDGPPTGPRTLIDGDVIDLTGLTNELTCGHAAPCVDAERRGQTIDRPWGANNARWQPFLYSSFTIVPVPRRPTPYVIVWLGDDGRETDGDPGVDGGGGEGQGRYVIRARAEAFGPGNARRAIEAELARVCSTTEVGEVCRPGIRVQSWRLASPVP